MTAIFELTLLRHGRSRADDEEVHEGRYDSPLTDVGRAQARARGEGWRAAGYRPDGIVASTLARAHEVANIVGGILNVPVVTDAGWMEIDNGPLAGLPFAVADERYPVPSSSHPFAVWHGTGESQADVHARVSGALQRIFGRPPGRYLVVSHGGALNAALRVLLGIPLPAHPAGVYFAFGDLGYARVAYRPAAHRCVVRELVPGSVD
ncbi:MAG: histidine phosphatase family protein [Burkholderiales bacterium]